MSDEQAREKILEFIENEEFEEINERPRIILVSRQFRTEVTASVLWLRKFGIDISCVKLSPYEMGKGEIAFESNIVIPLPEAHDFIVETERKENRSLTVSQVEYVEFYKDLIARLKPKIPRDYSTPQPRFYYQIPTALVHKSGYRRISSIGSKCLCNQITFGHAQLGHFVERQAADQCLRTLRFQ